MKKPNVLPYLKWINGGFQLVVMGVELPITSAQSRLVFAQLQQLEVSHG
ncbi:MAG: hypothetical protein WBF70_10180 [Aeromonas molluscorum]